MNEMSNNKLHLVLFAAFMFALTTWGAPAQSAEIVVYKSPTCECCKSWVAHMRQNGHTVKTQNLDDLEQIKTMAGVPELFRSCHTAMVDGYVIEGHVPAKDVDRLLKLRPKVRGLAVPGMVSGSPGMEQGKPEPYDVILFQSNGSSSVYARY
jgi:hypothetical protein